ncbi:efflux RND transporter periplasmic adaptor subunit [Volucribacter amazonae]|uniref:Efflux transporter periplasmic adaptor subunit n=1 Tax=Volucribacter amazonae TaxID=256731 RepID=A0A9X4SJK7_9PAST|nr:efflux RND transporter periplasmic adaptor subunit [Volucribacter amazonae]MDG6894224.1 efflux transporter periplasmic adaptor subunit [Volucribacter amazonae]
MNKKRILTIIIVLVLLLLGYYFFYGKNNNQITYLTETVSRGDLQKTVIANGTVRSANRVEVGAQVSGQIKKIYVQLGQQVKQGDVIAEIDSTTQQNNLNTAQAELDSYTAQLKAKKIAYEVAKSAFDRTQTLYQRKSASLDDFNTAKNNLAAAEADIEDIQASIKKAEIEVNTAQTNLGYTTITSPINGTIISIPVSEGQTVNANQTTPTIVQVADLSKMLIKAEISEGDITKIKAGQEVSFTTLSDPDIHYHSTIHSVDPAMSTLTDDEYSESVSSTDAVYYYANILIDNSDNKLFIGMSTTNVITIADVQDVLLVPSLTLKKQGNKTFVEVLNANHQVEQREVTTGLSDEMNTEILSGLQAGEKVISSQVANGEQVGNTGRGPRLF